MSERRRSGSFQPPGAHGQEGEPQPAGQTGHCHRGRDHAGLYTQREGDSCRAGSRGPRAGGTIFMPVWVSDLLNKILLRSGTVLWSHPHSTPSDPIPLLLLRGVRPYPPLPPHPARALHHGASHRVACPAPPIAPWTGLAREAAGDSERGRGGRRLGRVSPLP